MKKKAPPILASSIAAMLLISSCADPVETVGNHPETERIEACDTCHRGPDVTPAVVEDWYNGSHGKFMVPCYVCHGSVNEDFVASPTMERCMGCHAEQVDSMSSAFMKDKTCSSCHPTHSLEPHATSFNQGGKP
jgi:hypothetical protein